MALPRGVMTKAIFKASALLRRTFDAAALNAVANHPDVRPMLQGSGAIDLAPVISDAGNVALVGDGGGFILTAAGGGDYEVHTLFLPGSRDVLAKTLAGIDYMFTHTDCVRITTKIFDGNRPAAQLASAAGMVSLFRNAVLGCDCLELIIDSWAVNHADLEADGEAFHMAIDAAGLMLPAHPADAIHDRAVGAVVRMVRAGSVHKGIWFYNRWASHAGYPGIRLLSAQPPILDTGEGVIVALAGDGFEVLSCP
jgi:hypothetical protein